MVELDQYRVTYKVQPLNDKEDQIIWYIKDLQKYTISDKSLRKCQPADFFLPQPDAKIPSTIQSDENMSTEDEVQNKFYSYTNSSKLCAEGAIVNLMNVLKCSDLAHKNKSHGHSLYISIPPFPIKYSPPHILLCHHPFICTKLHTKNTAAIAQLSSPLPLNQIIRLTAIRVPVGSKTPAPQDSYCRNSNKSTLTTNTAINKHHHHGCPICPSYRVGSMDPPNLRQVTSLKGVGQGRIGWV